MLVTGIILYRDCFSMHMAVRKSTRTAKKMVLVVAAVVPVVCGARILQQIKIPHIPDVFLFCTVAYFCNIRQAAL